MKHILVTGGSGFIGSNLTLELQSRYPEATIRVLDDFRASSFKNLIGFRGDVLAFDASDPSWMKIFKGQALDAIFHLASITDTTVLDERKMMYENIEGFRNILDLGVEKSCPVVYASSAAVYGSQDEVMHIKDGGRPNNVYGFSKWVLEGLARTYQSRIQTVGLRYFNVFGPGEYFKKHASSMIYQLFHQMKAGKRPRIFKFGEQRRDHVYVKDVVACTILAHSAKSSGVMNVGTGKSTSFNEIIDALNEALGTKLEPDYFDNPYNFYQNFTEADMRPAKELCGFEPRYSTREGILDYVKNYLSKETAATSRFASASKS